MIVVDTSVILAILLREPDWRSVAAILESDELASAESLSAEVGNSLSSLVRRDLIEPETALTVWDAYISLPIRHLTISYPAALDLAFTYRMSSYDAYMITVALTYKYALVTLDKGMIHVARVAGVTVKGV